MNPYDRFLDLIPRPEPAEGANRRPDLLVPLEDFARALSDRAGVGAEVQMSLDHLRAHLAIWPLHRPAYRSLMLTIVLANDRAVLLGSPPFPFDSAEQLTEWLASFLQNPTFRTSLAQLRAAAAEPVDARLERENGMGTLVTVSPERQAFFSEQEMGTIIDVELMLEAGEPAPRAPELRVLNSAGIRYEILPDTVEVDNRTVRFRAVKVA